MCIIVEVAAAACVSRRGPSRASRLALVLGLFAALAVPGPSGRADTTPGLDAFRLDRFAEALHAWREAADAGDAEAALFIGVLYDAGQGVRQDYAQALEWYRRAASGGSAPAMFNVGVMYDAGLGMPRNPEEAARWYDRAAAKRFGRAEYNLALMLESGSDVPRDRARAIQLFRAASQDGLAAARAHLAALGIHVAGRAPVQEDVAYLAFQQAQQALRSRQPAETGRAAELLRQAAKAGNPMAEYDLGYCYENGIGVPSDKLEAYAWYKRSASEATSADLKAIAGSAATNLEAQLGKPQVDEAKQAITAPRS